MIFLMAVNRERSIGLVFSFPLITGHVVWPTSNSTAGAVWSLEAPVMAIFFGLLHHLSRWKGGFVILVGLANGQEKAAIGHGGSVTHHRSLTKEEHRQPWQFWLLLCYILSLHHRPYCITGDREMAIGVPDWLVSHWRGRCQAWDSINGAFGFFVFGKEETGRRENGDDMLTGFGVWVFGL